MSNVHAEYQVAHALGEQLLDLAQQVQDTAMLVAFHVQNSPGTAHMIACMRALGKPVVVIQVAATA